MRIALVAPLAEAVPPSSMAEQSGLCPGWRRSLLGKGTGLLCSRAPSRRQRPTFSFAMRKVCGVCDIGRNCWLGDLDSNQD